MRGSNVLLGTTLVLLFSLVVVGAYVAADPEAGEACGSSASWPLCNGQFIPAPSAPVIAEYSHRLLALLTAIFLFVTAGVYLRLGFPSGLSKMTLLSACLLMVFQIGLGDVVIGADLQPALVALHQASAITIFGLVVTAFTVRNRTS